MHDEIVKTVDYGNDCAVVLLDLSTTFDTIHHQILLQILNRRLAVEGRVLDWCHSCLSQRSQTFHINEQSAEHIVWIAVLGPRKFNGYMEEFAELLNSH